MGVSSYIEFVTTLFSWITYEAIWSVLAESGLIYAPFLIILMSNIIRSRRAGDDEGQAALQSLKQSETDLVLAIAVLFLVAVPFSRVELGEMRYVRPQLDCAIERAIDAGAPAVVSGAATDTTFDASLQQLDGQVGRIPIWWGFVHTVVKAVVAASVAGIPCTADVSAIEFHLENDAIESSQTRQQLAWFVQDCHLPAVSRYLANHPDAGPEGPPHLASAYWLTTPGYYDVLYSRHPLSDFPFDANRDAGLGADGSTGGHPTCQQWWQASGSGLRAQLLASLDSDRRDAYARDSDSLLRTRDAALSADAADDVLLTKYLALRLRQANPSGFQQLSVSYSPSAAERIVGVQQASNWFTRSLASKVSSTEFALDLGANAVAGLGAMLSAPGHLAAGVAAREGSALFAALAAMIFVCVLPVLLVLSLYRLSTVLTLTVVFVGLHFLYVLWGIAFWVDNQLSSALLDGGFLAITHPMQTTLIVWVQRFLYLVFPMLWLASLGWIGHHTGQLGMGLQQLSNGTGNAFASGGNAVSRAASAAVTKGR